MKRIEFLLLALLGTGCSGEAEEPARAEVTSGAEAAPSAEAEGAPPASDESPDVAMAMAAIEAEDVELEIYAIDVGQGDATLILGPEDTDGERITMLIDAGRKSWKRALKPLMERLEITALDYIVATHYDEDHIGGFTTPTGASILWSDRNCTTRSFFPTIAVIDPGPSEGETASEQQWDRCIDQLTGGTTGVEHIQVTGVNQIGRELDLGGDYFATIVAGGGFVLGTSTPIENVNPKNELSVAILVSNADGFDFLVTGDLIGQPSGAEDAELEGPLGEGLAAEGVVVEVLQVGHHGAANATEPSFIRAIQPEVAIISVGNLQKYGHPTPRAIKTLDDYDVPWILQTNQGKPKATVLLYDCDDEPGCVQTQQIVVQGAIHILVDDDHYDVRSLPDSSYYLEQEGLETRALSLECDLDGCVEADE